MAEFQPKIKEGEDFGGETLKMKDFFVEILPHSPGAEQRFENMSPRELFDKYRDFINGDVSFEHFLKVIGDESKSASDKEDYLKDGLNRELWLEYLLKKLPRNLVEKQKEIQGVNSEYDLNVLKIENLHEARKKTGHKLVLGFYTSSDKIHGGVIKQSKISTSLLGGGQKADLSPGHSYYSVSPRALYKSLSGYLTFVEGDEYEVKKQGEKFGDLHGGGSWVGVARDIPVLGESIKLDDEIVGELELKKF